jgi:hypothetical protein
VRPDRRNDAPGAPGFRITEIHAFIAVDPRDDSEGVIGHMNPKTGVIEAMIGADKARIESLRPIAEHVAHATGKPVKLVRFSQREDKEEFR